MEPVTDPLIASSELAATLGDPSLVIVDCRFELGNACSGEQAFASARIPGARYVHLERDLSDMAEYAVHGRHPLPSSAQVAGVFARLGIDARSSVVGYDADTGAYAARLWWLLRASGHSAVRVLDGGFAAWRAAGMPIESGVPRAIAATAKRPLELHAGHWLEVDALQRALTDASVSLIDARGAPRFRGEVEPIDAVAGHIPGAINRPFLENLDANGRFKPASVLRAEFDSLLVGRLPASVVHMCGSGVTACHNQLAMVRAGLEGSRLYADSWSGWITDRSRPVASGTS